MKVILSHPFTIKSLALLLPLIFLVSCKTYSEDDLNAFDKNIEAYIAKNKWKKMDRSESGLYSQVIIPGDSTTKAVSYTSEVSLIYKGKLLNGKTVDQSLPGKPLVSKLSGLIGGFQEGLFDQHKGATLRLIIPPNLAYGDKQEGKIPANSVLVFEVEIENVH